jgi:hypothetical protein
MMWRLKPPLPPQTSKVKIPREARETGLRRQQQQLMHLLLHRMPREMQGLDERLQLDLVE